MKTYVLTKPHAINLPKIEKRSNNAIISYQLIGFNIPTIDQY